MEYSTYSEAEAALDALAFELLTDLAEQGLIDELPAFDPSTCVYCHKPHSPQSCPEMRALLFVPDAPVCACGCDNDPDTHYGNLELAEAERLDDIAAERESAAVYQRDLIYPPLDVDFAPIGFEV